MAKPLPITDVKDLSGIWTDRVQNRNAANSHLRPIYGVDTETWQGDIFLVADSDGRYLDKITSLSVIEFLFNKKFQNAWNYFYHIGYDGNVILKLLGSSKLSEYLKTRKLSFEFEGYHIHYIPNKCLRITKGHHSSSFYDIAQFYGKGKLVDTYQKNIGRLDEQYLRLKGQREEFSPRFYRRHTSEVRNYCIKDCKLTKDLGVHWANIFFDTFGFYPQRWISPGYLAEKVLINKGINFPTFASISYDKQNFAFQSYFGARFEMLKRGFLGRAFQYDINSAYPYALTTIPDLTQGRWIDSEEIHPDAKLGFFHIVANVPSSVRVAPFPFRTRWGMIFYPFGKFETYVTLPELLAVRSLNIHTKIGFRILEGYQFIPSNNADSKYIFKDFILDQYRKRQHLREQKSPLERTIKLILNSMYGKMAQKTKVGRYTHIMGNLFCPVIAAHVTGYTRAQLLSLIHTYGLEQDLVAYATDSITTKKTLPSVITNDLGGLKLADQASDMFSIQNGFRRSNGKWKLRGIGFDKTQKVEIEHVDTIETRDGRVVLVLERKKPQRLKSAIRRGAIQEIGKFKTFKREIDLNADTKRFWPSKITTVHCDHCIASIPLDVNLDGNHYTIKSGLLFFREQEEYNPYDDEDYAR